ncbi:uncharacterized protein [Phyllobates terribilis]|uniref:uncharacterized protein n=1 Tax=Phyllobates terribilis TaxID=111132 RepID=UPI003CCAF50E
MWASNYITQFDVIFDRQTAIRLSGLPEKAYIRSFNSLQSMLDISIKLDVRELGIQFGCVRLIPLVRKGLSLYKERFLASLPATRRSSTDFNRHVFTSVAFYLCAKNNKLNVDKIKLVELCGTSESESGSVSTSMMDLWFRCIWSDEGKKEAKEIKGNRELLDVFLEKRTCNLSDDENELQSYIYDSCNVVGMNDAHLGFHNQFQPINFTFYMRLMILDIGCNVVYKHGVDG